MSSPQPTGGYEQDTRAFSAFWQGGLLALDRLPHKPDRDEAEQQIASTIIEASRRSRVTFLQSHARNLYRNLTQDLAKHVRVEQLAYLAADAVPGLSPTHHRVASENNFLQKDKDGHEVDQGLLFNHFLADPTVGMHLCHTMLLPRQEALDLLPQLDTEAEIDLGTARYQRCGSVSTVYLKNSRYLNAEDDTTVHNVEIAIDLALLDPATSIVVIRGDKIDAGKYSGKSVFCTGINLTHLYQGKIPYLWYLVRDLGFINKMYRGLAKEGITPDEVLGDGIEKPFVAVVEKFAIGGGCQYLLATDYVLSADDAYITLPARKEGIIPGAANLRLPRFVGDRVSRQAIMSDRRIESDSAEGRLICDEVVPARELESALLDVTHRLTTSGVVSAASNRRAFRVGQEPLDLFRRYMAVYAREQAHCHFSPALIRNLEMFWNTQSRAA
ncbi:enoyl-CoA hydratase/isomerase family protein [Agrobacterium tumefaciens]|nr:enoyl-CoA hydratase/isomerase family protein [Agrobacterium tumefaciens]NTE24725.1 enoyl-CoA hydratase/isomerase family protein [Agrobacterium tumefaciens]